MTNHYYCKENVAHHIHRPFAGLYNLLVYTEWERRLPSTRRVLLPMEHAFSYTMGHKWRAPTVDDTGRVLTAAGEVPPIVHQYNKGVAGRWLHQTRFVEFVARLDRSVTGARG